MDYQSLIVIDTAGLPDAALWILVLALAAVAWGIQRARRPERSLRVDPEELALMRRAADGDEAAARELVRRGDEETAALRRRAESDREAALAYRDQLARQLKTLDGLPAQLAGMDVSEAKRQEVSEKVAAQQMVCRRELEWVEARLRGAVD